MNSPSSVRKPRGFKADKCMSYYEIEGHAMNARRLLVPDVALDAPPPSVALFENLDNWSFSTLHGQKQVSYGVVELPLGTEARTRFDKLADTALSRCPYLRFFLRGAPTSPSLRNFQIHASRLLGHDATAYETHPPAPPPLHDRLPRC